MARTLFSNPNAPFGLELWITDGTPVGTSMLAAINPNAGSSPGNFAAIDTRVVFSAFTNTAQAELWITDGTTGGTTQVKDINPAGSSNPNGFTALGSRLVFAATDDEHGTELWITDGSAAGTSLVTDIRPGVGSSTPGKLFDVAGGVAFWADDGTHGTALWITDGSAEGTSILQYVRPGGGGTRFSQAPFHAASAAGQFQGRTFFSGIGQSGANGNQELWVTDGTTAGTSMLKDINPDPAKGSYPAFLTILGDQLLFRANDGTHGYELWTSDGTAAGTSMLKDIYGSSPYPGAMTSSYPREITVAGDKAFFSAGDLSDHHQLWVTDGTAAGTSLVLGIIPGAPGTTSFHFDRYPKNITALGSKVLFTADDGSSGNELWISDGTAAGTSIVTDITGGTGVASVNKITVNGSRAYFTNYASGGPPTPWVTDGTAAGTQVLLSRGVASFNLFSAPNLLACFRAGTRIATPGGEVTVEALRAGDIVLTRGGRAAPVRWVGHRRLDVRRHRRPWDVMPVRIRPGAFGAGQPTRDLFLSPDHAVFVGGCLVPIRHLINGRTITQGRVAEVTYHHVELPAHDVLLAEGLECESYLDTGNRAAFENGGPALALHPDFARAVWQAGGYAPLLEAGPALEAIRASLLAIAAAAGHGMSSDPALRVLVGRHPLPLSADGAMFRVALPRGCEALRLASRRWIPAHTNPAGCDTRQLGVAIAALQFDGKPVALDDPRLSSGWHAPEPKWRWTDGNAGLALAGVREIAFRLAPLGYYWTSRRAA